MSDRSRLIDADRPPGRKAMLEEAMKRERRAVLVVNTRSRRRKRLYAEARRLLEARGCNLAEAHPVRDPSRVPEIITAAIEAGHKFIIVGGGDGTITSVMGAIAHRDAVLGILPLGTANSFARAVGIPLDLAAAIDVLFDGKVADVDLGKIDNTYFGNTAAVGLPGAMARTMPAALKRLLGRAAYPALASVRLLRHRPFRCAIAQQDATIDFHAVEVRIANGGYQAGFLVADEASLESCDLIIQIVKGRSIWKLVKTWALTLAGIAPSSDDVEVLRWRDLIIRTDPAQDVSIDGEPVGRTPIRASVASQALLLMIPRHQKELV
jgi:YegS/Rv2252/BmrU family lipid kinase